MEPLHDEEHSATREKIERKGMSIAPEKGTFEGVDIDTWAYWIAKAIDAKVARIVSGELPAFDASKARRSFITADEPDPTDRLAAAVEAQTLVLKKLIDRLG